MSYQEELQRLVGAKESMRQSIVAKGVDVPETAKIETYPEYIAQITGGGSVPDAPDLSQVLTKQDLDDIQAIVKAGKASEKLSLGDKLLVGFGAGSPQPYTMPFEIVGFDDVVIQDENGEDKTTHAINLLAGYAVGPGTTFGTSGYPYSESALRNFINSTYTSQVNSDFLACLGNTKVQSLDSGKTLTVVYDKLFAPSSVQIGVTDSSFITNDQISSEGPIFPLFDTSDSTVRVRNGLSGGAARDYWTRSLSVAGTQPVYIQTSGQPANGFFFNNYWVVAACNFIGGIS